MDVILCCRYHRQTGSHDQLSTVSVQPGESYYLICVGNSDWPSLSSDVISFQYVIQVTDKAAFLVRQYIKYNLYDRISTKPFFTPIEKKWIAFQLLSALSQCHSQNVSHSMSHCVSHPMSHSIDYCVVAVLVTCHSYHNWNVCKQIYFGLCFHLY